MFLVFPLLQALNKAVFMPLLLLLPKYYLFLSIAIKTLMVNIYNYEEHYTVAPIRLPLLVLSAH